jgi:carbonic anhydrase
MKGLCRPEMLEPMPNVAAWLRHSHAAFSIVCQAYPDNLSEAERVRAVGMENVVVQLDHLKTHPSVAAKLATNEITLHGWFFDIETGEVQVYDGALASFTEVQEGEALPVAFTGRNHPHVMPRVSATLAGE